MYGKIVGSNIYATGSPFKVFKRENNRAWSNISDSIPISRGDIEEKAVVMVRVFSGPSCFFQNQICIQSEVLELFIVIMVINGKIVFGQTED